MTRSRNRPHRAHAEADVPLWTEALFGAELLLLHATPVYYGFGVPQGDDSGVVVIPGFLGTDLYLMELHACLSVGCDRRWNSRISKRDCLCRFTL